MKYINKIDNSHELVKELQPGDIILHMTEVKSTRIIIAYSEVESDFEDVLRPYDQKGKYTTRKGHCLKTKYNMLQVGIDMYANKDVLRRPKEAKGHPFTVVENACQGYLYKLNEQLWEYFLEEFIMYNPQMNLELFDEVNCGMVQNIHILPNIGLI